MLRISVLAAAVLLAACPTAPKCELDAGPGAQPTDAGASADAGSADAGSVDAGPPPLQAVLRFLNLTPGSLLVTLDGDDAGTAVPAGGQLLRHAHTGHVTVVKRTATLVASGLRADGGSWSASDTVELPLRTVTADLDTDGQLDVVASLHTIDSTPARISTNLTVPKQTQGGFGARLGLVGGALPGGAILSSALRAGLDFDGDCVADVAGEAGKPALLTLSDGPTPLCDDAPFAFVEPLGLRGLGARPYITLTASGLYAVVWVPPLRVLHSASGGDAVERPAPVWTWHLPDVYVLNAAPSREPATLRLMSGGSLVEGLGVGQLGRLSHRQVSALLDAKGPGASVALALTLGGAAARTVTFAGAAAAPSAACPCCPPYLCDALVDADTLLLLGDVNRGFTTVSNVLKTKHDTVKNSINNVRALTPGTTLAPEADVSMCFVTSTTDDVCVMGDAVPVNQASVHVSAGGGAAAASYAATGRLLPPAKVVPNLPFKFAVDAWDDAGVKLTRHTFSWGDQAQVPADGFVLVAPGELASTDTAAASKRSLVVVDTTSKPWRATQPLSSR